MAHGKSEMAGTNEPNPAAEQTRQALLEKALELFGKKGFAAASTREIAAAANANVASIAYHFKGKEGLRQACAEYAAGFIGKVAQQGFEFGQGNSVSGLRSDEARRMLMDFLVTVTRTLLTSRTAERIVRFVLREITDQSPVLPVIYAAVIEPTHRRLCGLWAATTGEDADSEAVKLAVFAIIGQALYFRIGHAIVIRRMNWDGYDVDNTGRIAEEVVANLASALDRHSAAENSRKTGGTRL